MLQLLQEKGKCIILVATELSEDALSEFQRKLKPEGLAIFYWNEK
jgi:hypothetical protein